ncbi:5'-nucleotidase [Hoylesella marshii]|uniref:5'-nucleotidase n=1 Tax=Hoylesella marshii TaxID=189722 RepID=UPI0028D262FC|nr:5'-nucleotidase [Hoylesella marshii]
MAYPIDKKLVIAVASSALFDLTESDSIFKQRGEDKYREYQKKNIDNPFNRGVAFPFIKRLLTLNRSFPEERPIEVVLMSKNSPETGDRVFRSISHYQLDITRACFTSGKSNFQYLPAFNASLFLSANLKDVQDALDNECAAGRVLESRHFMPNDDEKDTELRIAFDFDGVLASDESEKIYQRSGAGEYFEHESQHSDEPLRLGPIGGLLQKISFFQKLEKKKVEETPDYHRILKTAIITARNAPAHERVVTSLMTWGVEVDETFFLGGIEKSRVLNIMRPHIFFDDQLRHLTGIDNIPAVHIPFGIANK